MIKNPTPRQVSLFTALFITLITFIIFFVLFWVFDGIRLNWTWIAFPFLIFLTAYYTSFYYIKNYIYRKIKVIYKTIHRHKRSPEERTAKFEMAPTIFEDVEKEVEQWADIQEKEIDKYKTWAEYRRKFVGDISHELKTPIFSIQGYLHSLIDGGLYDEEVNMSFLQKAAKNVERLYTIVEDLSAIARLESGGLVLEMQVFDIKELTQEVFEDLEMRAAEKNIKLEFKEGAGHNYRVRADRENIRQVLTNLVHNSIKYGNPNGKTKVGFYDMDKNLLVEVADNGIGIPKQHLNHVFDRFYRVDKRRSREQGGSGLGLSIVKHIIEAHKQTINVRSTPNLGSTFGFTLEKA